MSFEPEELTSRILALDRISSKIERLRSCLEDYQRSFASVILSMTMRVIFSVVPVRISTSFAKRLKLPSHAKVCSTIKRTGKTAKVSLPELKMSKVSDAGAVEGKRDLFGARQWRQYHPSN